MSPEAAAPALERGLAMLEMLSAASEDVGFNEFAAALEIPKPTVARLLKVLCRLGYALKEPRTGRYRAGPRLAGLGKASTLADRLSAAAGELLPELRDLTRNTAIMFLWTGVNIQCLAKSVEPTAVAMQDPGNVCTKLLVNPWGWIFYLELSEAKQLEVLRAQGEGPKTVALLERMGIFYQQNGFMLDAESPQLRRLAVPIRDADGRVVGALALGGTPFTLGEAEIGKCGRLLQDYAARFSRQLGFKEESP